MKKVIIAIIVLAVILAAGILETLYIDKIFGELDGRLEEMEREIKAESDNALTVTHDLFEWWEHKRRYVETFTFSPDIRAFSVALAEAEGSLECGDFNNAMSKCQSLMSMSVNMHRILDFNFEDVI